MISKETLIPGTWIQDLVQCFTRQSPENSLQNDHAEKAWADPLIGFSRGDDPLYQEFKVHVGPFHWTPEEIFTRTFPDLKIHPEELTVISWVLPQTVATILENQKETLYPSEKWARSRFFGEKFNVSLRNHVAASLQREGYQAVAPSLSPLWAMEKSELYGLASTWSERHVAYASGLGTFGLSDGLITARGKAMRVGSVVARVQIQPTAKLYTNHQEYCLFAAQGRCGKCISRCPVNAISKKGHDKELCLKHVKRTAEYVPKTFGFNGYACGLCQTGVPCESGIPARQRG